MAEERYEEAPCVIGEITEAIILQPQGINSETAALYMSMSESDLATARILHVNMGSSSHGVQGATSAGVLPGAPLGTYRLSAVAQSKAQTMISSMGLNREARAPLVSSSLLHYNMAYFDAAVRSG